MKQENYADIIKRMRHGDDKAVAELVNKTMNLTLNITGNLLYDRNEMEDTIQDIYIKVWENLDKYDEGKGNFISWFARLIRNQCIDRNRRIRINAEDKIPPNIPDGSVPADEEMHRANFRNEVLKLSEKLPEKQKEVFMLRDIQSLSISDVQKITGQTRGSIKTNLYLARKRIREMMDPDWKI